MTLALPNRWEWIDIGAPSLIRAAAKNHAFVAVLTDPHDYPRGDGSEMEHNAGAFPKPRERSLPSRHFSLRRTMTQSSPVTMRANSIPVSFHGIFSRTSTFLHAAVWLKTRIKRARFTFRPQFRERRLLASENFKVKNCLTTTMLDFDAAFQIACASNRPCAVIVKHNNPCGVAAGTVIADLCNRKARAADSDCCVWRCGCHQRRPSMKPPRKRR